MSQLNQLLALIATGEPENIEKAFLLDQTYQLDLVSVAEKKYKALFSLSNIISSEESEAATIKKLIQLFSQTEIRKEKGVITIPPEIGELTNLKELDFSHNLRLEKLPPEIKNLTNLEYLDLSKTAINKVPFEIYELKNLQYLDLSKLAIYFISDEIEQLEKLEFLDLSDTLIHEFPRSQLKPLKNIKEVHFKGKVYHEIPNLIQKKHWKNIGITAAIVTCVIFLYFKDITLLLNEYKTQGIEEYQQTGEYIDFDKAIMQYENAIKFELLSPTYNFHERINELTHLQELIIHEKTLDSLPIRIGLLEKLEILNFSNNKITKLPNEICSIKSLKYISARQNRIFTLPTAIENLTSLTILDLDSNYIKHLPSEVGNLHQLQELYLSHNPLSNIPVSITSLKNLTTLTIDAKAFQQSISQPNKREFIKFYKSLNDLTLTKKHTISVEQQQFIQVLVPKCVLKN